MNGSTEELVWIESEDDLRLDGVVVRPNGGQTKPIALVHVHGFTSRFSHPAHIHPARELAKRGYTCISGNNRGWAFGETTSRLHTGEQVVIGTGWERFAEVAYDIGPWISFAMSLGFEAVALFGHSYGGCKVVQYLAEREDPRVRALILASPGWIHPPVIAPNAIEQATSMVAAGKGAELLPWGSFYEITLSAQTMLELTRFDVFGVRTTDAPISKVRVPTLAFYGTNEDEGRAELDLMRSKATAVPRFDTLVIEGANHSYIGRAPQVGAAVADWLDGLS
jgi:pimeloyl-ACP methyl ester carboxylesterase